ncbi:MAG: hypothetical protein ACTSPV_12515 [Candidatus Hodarchaeales archaeon]
MLNNPLPFLIDSSIPWVKYNTIINLLKDETDDNTLLKARTSMLKSDLIQLSINKARTWDTAILKRHNDASHPIHSLEILAEFGLKESDPEISQICKKILSRVIFKILAMALPFNYLS